MKTSDKIQRCDNCRDYPDTMYYPAISKNINLSLCYDCLTIFSDMEIKKRRK